MKRTLRFLPLLALSLPLLACGCVNFWPHRVVAASSEVVSETREVSGFDGVELSGIGKIILEQGSAESLEISGPENVLPLVETSVRGGTLVIEMQKDVAVTGMHSANMLTFTVGVRELSSISVSGAGDVEMDALSADRLDVTMSGAGRIDLKGLDLEDLELTLSGAGDVHLAGRAALAEIEISGTGNIDADNLEIANARVSISGLGNATVWATERLSGTISGAGNVDYFGEPDTDFHTSGLGRYRSLGDK